MTFETKCKTFVWWNACENVMQTTVRLTMLWCFQISGNPLKLKQSSPGSVWPFSWRPCSPERQSQTPRSWYTHCLMYWIGKAGDSHHFITVKSLIRCTRSQSLNVSRLVLQLSLPNPLKPDVKLGMKMWLEQHWQAMLQYIWVINNFIAY